MAILVCRMFSLSMFIQAETGPASNNQEEPEVHISNNQEDISAEVACSPPDCAVEESAPLPVESTSAEAAPSEAAPSEAAPSEAAEADPSEVVEPAPAEA